MLQLRVRLFCLMALSCLPLLAHVPVSHTLALRHLQLEGDVQIIGNGSLIFSDNTVQSTAGITAIMPGAGIAVSGAGTPTVAIDPAQVQKRITATCVDGGGFLAVNQDGSVTCSGVGKIDVVTGGDMLITAPPGVTYLIVEAWSGGGGGSAGVGVYGGSGGGAGGYARVLIPANAGPFSASVGYPGKMTTGATGEDGQATRFVSANQFIYLTITGGRGGGVAAGGLGGDLEVSPGALLLQSSRGGNGASGAFFGVSGSGGASPFGSMFASGGAGCPSGATSTAGSPGLMLITYH